jgi:hypothetical protein
MAGPTADSTGYQAQTLQEILEEVQGLARRAPEDGGFGPGVAVGSTSALGHILLIVSELGVLLQQAEQSNWDALDANNASGVNLDRIFQGWLGAATRNLSTKAEGSIAYASSAAATVPSGSIFRQSDTGTRAVTTAAGTTANPGAWANGTAYSVEDLRTNSGNVYICTTAGTSAGAGGPTGTGDGIADNTCVWSYVGSGGFAALIAAEAENKGLFSPTAASFDEAVTTIANVTGVKNGAAWTPGTDEETDSAYRTRGVGARDGVGGGSPSAIYRVCSALDFVSEVLVRDNKTNAVDALGDPGHSVHIIFVSPLTFTAAQETSLVSAIANVVPAGIQMVGAEQFDLTLSTGQVLAAEIRWDFATQVRVYATATMTTDADLYPANGDTLVSTAITSRVYAGGEDVRPNQIEADITEAVPGVIDVSVALDTAPAPAVRQVISISDLQVCGTGGANGIQTADVTVV